MNFPDVTGTPSQPNPSEFTEYFTYACQRYQILVDVVRVDAQENTRPDNKKKIGRSKSKLGVLTFGATVDNSTNKTSVSSVEEDKGYLARIMAKYDTKGLLTHLTFRKCRQTIPWEIFRVLNEIAHFYTDLCSITVINGLNAYSLNEIKKLFKVINITELYLDDTCDPKFKLASLLENAKNLKVLSLARCKLGDIGISEIIKNMESPKPPHKTLYALNISSNALTDESVKNLAQMLRTNRTLSYLNLNGNRITTEGAVHILKVLTKFQLTDEETKSYKAGWTQYLRAKQELMEKFIDNYNGPTKTVASKKKATKPDLFGTNVDEVEKLAAEYAVNTLGKFDNAFYVPEVEKGKLYCTGNNVVTYLGLCYNHIDYPFLSALLDTLRYQSSFLITKKERGLTFVKIEGNPLPTSCPELREIDDILTKALNEITKQKKIIVARFKK